MTAGDGQAQQGLLTNPRRSVNGTESPVMQNTLRTSAGFSLALKHWCFCANKNGALFSTDSLPEPRYPVCCPRTYHSVPPPIPGSPEFLLFLLCSFASACFSGTSPSHFFLQMTFSLSYLGVLKFCMIAVSHEIDWSCYD